MLRTVLAGRGAARALVRTASARLSSAPPAFAEGAEEPFEFPAGASRRGPAHASPSISGGAGAASMPFPDEARQNYADAALYPGAGTAAFDKAAADVLGAPVDPADVEIKPDGALYLPESRYRRVLNRAFGVGGWALLPRGPHVLAPGGVLSREYALVAHGRFVSQARGHGAVPAFSTPAMASEVVRSNALMRLCKDLGVANELFDPAFVASWRASRAVRRVENGRARWAKRDSSESA